MNFLNESNPNSFQLVILKNTFPDFYFINLILLLLKKDYQGSLVFLSSQIEDKKTLKHKPLKDKENLFRSLFLFILNSTLNLEEKASSFFIALSYLLKSESIKIEEIESLVKQLFENLDSTRKLNKFNLLFEKLYKKEIHISKRFKILKTPPKKYSNKIDLDGCIFYF